jgi:hypothetical protein
MINFISNESNNTLNKRLGEIIGLSHELKFLVGFFYFSGIQEFYQAICDYEGLQIKILVGLQADRSLGHLENRLPFIQLIKAEKQQVACQFLETRIGACVMKCYFREHMAERDLLFQDAVAAQLQDYDSEADTASQTSCIETLHARRQATGLPQKLQAIPKTSLDLLGVILKEGKV